MSKKGISASVFRGQHDSTLNGASKEKNNFVLESEFIQGGNLDLSEEKTENILIVYKKFDLWRAVPKAAYLAGVWEMFGGNFIYTPDSRFPSDAPIKIYDRDESKASLQRFRN